MLKRTALFAAHQQLGGKLIEFGGWEMPVQYTSVTDEHLAVRNTAGIFDISHMGEVTVSGAGAANFLNAVLTNDIRKLAPGEGQYTLMCQERGGVIDDLYAYRLSGEVFLLIINASRIEPDVAWLQAQAAKFPRRGELQLTDASHNYAAVAAWFFCTRRRCSAHRARFYRVKTWVAFYQFYTVDLFYQKLKIFQCSFLMVYS